MLGRFSFPQSSSEPAFGQKACSTYTKNRMPSCPRGCSDSFSLKGLILVTTSMDSRARRGPSRPAGALKGLCAGAIAAALFTLGSVAHADVFGGQSASKDTEQLRQRLSQLEQDIRLLKESGGAPAAPGAAGPGNLTLPEPPEVKASVPKTYRVVGEVNGRFLVRAGNARMLFTAEELKQFDQEEAERALAKAAQPDAAPAASAPGKPTTPPPAVGPTSRVGQAPVPPAKPAAAATPAATTKPGTQPATAKK
ncbi:hypothetical protein LMG26857_03574 [Achromobacter anxifer]|nr:hypothetical protein LMG26857_03574 [Achromobacter anxifer]